MFARLVCHDIVTYLVPIQLISLYYKCYYRYLTGIRIIEDGDKNEHIGYRDKLESHIISIFKQRAEMHDKAYKHKVCLRIETM